MEAFGGAFGGLVMLLILIFGSVLIVLWIILPFAVFGINKRLDRVIWESEKLNTKMQTFIDILTERKKAHSEQQSHKSSEENNLKD